ncbi:hypothetical protein CAL7102_05723 [Dulcicalothrix desertica PCC 7102]|nr:hypothetical protein CAL7102_05723 [Dulcicalothrix desertica PCC 7102]
MPTVGASLMIKAESLKSQKIVNDMSNAVDALRRIPARHSEHNMVLQLITSAIYVFFRFLRV